MTQVIKVFTNKYVSAALWFGLSLIAALRQVTLHHYNNYLVYKYTFINLISRTNLYLPRPSLFQGIDHYGPIFAFVIAPFTVLPDTISIIVWVVSNAGFLYYSIQQLPLNISHRNFIISFCAIELMIASTEVQFGPAMVALMIFSFILIRKQQDVWAALLIVMGTYIKLYSIIGLIFFLFSKHKLKFTGSILLWGLVLFVLPMLFSSPAFIIQSYYDWFSSLKEERALHTVSTLQNISVMTTLRNGLNYPQLKTFTVLIGAAILFVVPLSKINRYHVLHFQLLILASVLIATVIFNTRSIQTSYVAAMVGMAIWFATLTVPISLLNIYMLIFAFVVTSLFSSTIYLLNIDNTFITNYALEALPCTIIWIKILYDAAFSAFGFKQLSGTT